MFGLLKRLARGLRRPNRDRRVHLSLETLEERLNLSPTAQQEYMLELINRMRTNPAAELSLLLHANDPNVTQDLSYFNVNQQVLAQQWASLTPVAPLAWNAALAQSATGHSQLMLQDDQQAHQLTGEADPGTRMANAGYAPANTFDWGENIFAYARSVFESHAAFAIDWGSTSTGLQSPAGHRENLMSPNYQEVGIGVVSGQGQQVGPLLITQDFAGSSYATGNGEAFMVGAVFSDANGDGFYNPGEGVAGVTITVTDSSGNSVTTTTGSAGDYQLQLPAGTYSVTASGGGIGTQSPQSVTVGSANIWLNFGGATILPAPTVTGPTGTVASNMPTITWSASNGAAHYELMLNDSTTATMLLDQTNLTNNAFALTNVLSVGHKYTAEVRAVDAAGDLSGWSKPFAFTVVLPAAPTVTGPAGTVVTAFPTFTWTASAGADHYGLTVSDLTSNTGRVIWQQNVAGTSFTPTSAVTAGHQYAVWVRAYNAAGQAGNWSTGHTFTIATPPAPTLTGPTGSSTNPDPTLTWSNVASATAYGLTVADATTGVSRVIWQPSLTGTTFTPATLLVAGHSYTAWVRSLNDAGQAGNWSTGYRFTIALPPAPAVPVLTGPTGSVATQTPTITWSTISGADHYDLWVDDLTAGVSQVIRQRTLTTTSYTPTTPLLHGHRYEVWVRSFDSLGQTRGFSTPVVFTVL